MRYYSVFFDFGEYDVVETTEELSFNDQGHIGLKSYEALQQVVDSGNCSILNNDNIHNIIRIQEISRDEYLSLSLFDGLGNKKVFNISVCLCYRIESRILYNAAHGNIHESSPIGTTLGIHSSKFSINTRCSFYELVEWISYLATKDSREEFKRLDKVFIQSSDKDVRFLLGKVASDLERTIKENGKGNVTNNNFEAIVIDQDKDPYNLYLDLLYMEKADKEPDDLYI